MNLNLKRGFGALLVGASAVGLAAVAASPALADTTPFGTNVGPLLGKLYLTPNTGSGTTAFTLNSDGACPATSTRITGLIYHQDTNPAQTPPVPADPRNDWNDVTLVSNTSNGVSTTGPMTVGISNNLFNTANANSKNMQPGVYTVDLYCSDSLGASIKGYFQASFNLTNTAAGGAASQTATYSAAAQPAAIGTTTTVSATPATTTAGQAVTLTAAVTPASAGPDALTGSVQFFDGSTSLGTSSLSSAGNATMPISTLAVGSHSITAHYLGSFYHSTSTSPAATETVNPKPADDTTSTLSVAVNGTNVTSPGTAHTTDNVALGGTVANATTPGVTPVGTCQFLDGVSSLGTAPVAANGTCNVSLGQLPAKPYQITMKFTPPTGGTQFNPSDTTATPFSLNVAAPTTPPISQTVNVTMAAGSLTIGLKSGQTGVVNLATPVLRSDAAWFESLPQATGNVNLINSVIVSDNRAGNPGWEVRGIMSDFKSGSNLIRANNLFWAPQPVASKAAGQNITMGPVVAPTQGVPPVAPSDPASAAGLGSSRQLAIAAAGAGLGTAQLDANLSLIVPSSTPSGIYSGTLTLTVS
jgi:hypothetical protein